jgi:hypothetical protein
MLFLSAPTMWAAKSAILALYIRVFGTVQWLRRTAYASIVLMVPVYSLNMVVAGVYCMPGRGESWGGERSLLRCYSAQWPVIAVGVFSCLADLLILLLPFPIITILHIDLRKKVALAAVFGSGLM